MLQVSKGNMDALIVLANYWLDNASPLYRHYERLMRTVEYSSSDTFPAHHPRIGQVENIRRGVRRFFARTGIRDLITDAQRRRQSHFERWMRLARSLFDAARAQRRNPEDP